MRKFRINVNGTSYNVEVEELSGFSAPVAAASAPVAAAPAPVAAAPAPVAAAPAPVAAAPAAAVPMADGTQVKAPMPGAILDVRVSVGDMVKEGDVLLILEAMKMENDILAPKDGKVVSVQTSKGSNANAGEVLVVIA